jgi:hypothetical protein
MVRLRATFHAVPSRVWTSVAGLAVLASLALAVVLGAGLEVWRGAVGSPTANPRAGLSNVPPTGVVTVPSGPTHRARGHTAPGHPVAPVARQPAPTPTRTQAPPPAVGQPPPAPTAGSGAPGGSDGSQQPAVSLPVVSLDALLANLRGSGRRAAVQQVSALVLQPALHSWSVDGEIEGSGPDDLLAIVRAHVSHGAYMHVLAAVNKARDQSTHGHADSAHGHAPAHGKGND